MRNLRRAVAVIGATVLIFLAGGALRSDVRSARLIIAYENYRESGCHTV